jgi:hypothetical protein
MVAKKTDVKIEYWRTWLAGSQMTHYAAQGEDYSFCGTDLIGDALVHDKPPKLLSKSKHHRVTCKQCLQQTELARTYLTSIKKGEL